MTFTIEQLEAMKEGTTPGLWAAVADYPYVSIVEAADEDGESTAIADIVSEKTEITPDHDLMAASPALLDQLIAREAELQKLREEMALLASKVGVRAANAQTNGAFSSAVAFRETASAIIKILEETND